MPTDIKAKGEILRAACEELRGADYCTGTVVQGLEAVSMSETHFGRAGKFRRDPSSDEPEGWESYNYGALQCGMKAEPQGQCPAGCFPHGDSSPITGAYVGCFRAYPTEKEGALAFTKLLVTDRKTCKGQPSAIPSALASGQTWDLAEAMYGACYYEGRGATVRDRIRGEMVALQRNAQEAATRTGDPLSWVAVEPPPPAPITFEGVGLGAGLGATATLVGVAAARAVARRLGVDTATA